MRALWTLGFQFADRDRGLFACFSCERLPVPSLEKCSRLLKFVEGKCIMKESDICRMLELVSTLTVDIKTFVVKCSLVAGSMNVEVVAYCHAGWYGTCEHCSKISLWKGTLIVNRDIVCGVLAKYGVEALILTDSDSAILKEAGLLNPASS